VNVQLTGVAKSYGGTPALQDIDLEIGTGVTGLLGPNGAGKTTLLRIIATSIAPDRGKVRLLGHDPHRGHAELVAARRGLGYLPQELGYPADMSTFGFVEYLAVLKEWNDRRARQQEVRRVLGLVDLADLAGKRVSKLSGGQRRRVGLAQALLGDPALLVLDEPTTGLDPAQRATLRRTLSVAARQSSVLLSTHQTEDVAAVCDRVIVLVGGRVAHDGDVAGFVASARDRVWLHDRPVADAVATWRDPAGGVRSVGGTPPTGAQAAPPTVEDAYLLLVGPAAVEGAA